MRVGEDKTEVNGEKQAAESSRWYPPPQGVIKLNSDAALEQKERRIGLGGGGSGQKGGWKDSWSLGRR